VVQGLWVVACREGSGGGQVWSVLGMRLHGAVLNGLWFLSCVGVALQGPYKGQRRNCVTLAAGRNIAWQVSCGQYHMHAGVWGSLLCTLLYGLDG